jgi:membrane protein
MPDGAEGVGFRISRANPIFRLWFTLRRAAIEAYRNNCLGLAKGAAYSALLAFFPVLTTLTAILIQANADSVSRSLSNLVFEVVPPGTEEIVRYNFTERGQRPFYVLVLATLLALWAASGVMVTLMQGFQAAYEVKDKRSIVRQRLMAIALAIFTATPVVAASALMVFGERIERMAITSLGVLPEGEQLKGWISFLTSLSRYVAAFAGFVLGTAMLYRFGPDYRGKLRNVWPGAVLATVLWWLTTGGFGWYVRNIANYNVLYGTVGAVAALMVWMYLLSIIALIGCQFNAERERMSSAGLVADRKLPEQHPASP